MVVKNYGPGVSGYLDPSGRAWETVVFQASKPVLDKELSLTEDLGEVFSQGAFTRSMPSGWLADDLLASSQNAPYFTYQTTTPNALKLTGNLLAHVNGWLVPVANTLSMDGSNIVDLGTAPVGAGVKRTDLVVLEVWRRLLSATPSTDGKSALGRIWWNGNVKIDPAQDAVLNFIDDIQDAMLGAESTKRVQIQYRLRVIQNVDLFSFPFGINDTTVFAHSVPPNAGTPDGTITAFSYTNQVANGDQGLWRAGDGIPSNTLGTVDGYMYALPLCAVFRFNSTAFDRLTNHNGADAFPTASRPDGGYHDIPENRQVADLRTGVSPAGWDYHEVLEKNFNFVLDNTLNTEWTTTPNGGGVSGHTVLWADEIGISNVNGGDGIITGDTPGATFIGEFDATRRYFSDRPIVETIVVQVAAPGGGWVGNDVVTIDPTSLTIPPYTAFNWAAYNPSTVAWTDITDAHWIGAPGANTYDAMPYIKTITGLGAMPVVSLTVTTVPVVPGPLTNEPLYLTLVVSYPPGIGLTKTGVVDTMTTVVSVNNPAQLPAASPVDFSALVPSVFDGAHREIYLAYDTDNVTIGIEADSVTVGASSFRVWDRVQTVVSVLKNAVPIVGTVTIDSTGRILTFTNPLDYTSPGDDITLTYTARRPLPQNDEQLTIYYQATAPQPIRTAILDASISIVPRAIGKEIASITVGSGSLDDAYPFPVAYNQVGGILIGTNVGSTFDGDYQLGARGDISITDFESTTGYVRLPAFIGYVPQPEAVTWARLLGDVDIEDRSYFPLPNVGYIPNAYAQNFSDAKRHRNILPILAELTADTLYGYQGQLVLVLLIREAVYDPNNSVFGATLPADTSTTAAVYHLKGNLLVKRAS